MILSSQNIDITVNFALHNLAMFWILETLLY